jgi:DHA3 family macrolide efflux protein-like MFS transporter
MQTEGSAGLPSTESSGGGELTGSWQLRFWTIWSGQALSLIGSALTQFVLIWWITLEVGSASALAIAGVMALLPQALLGPVGGVVADRYSRRLIMILADSVTAACMGLLVWLFATGRVELWHVYTMMAIRSSMQAFQFPAATASTAMLVPQSWLERVAGLNQAMQGVMTIAAAPLGALLLAFFPFQGALMIDIVTALLGIVPLFFYAIPQHKRLPAQASTGDGADALDGSPVDASGREPAADPGFWGGFWRDFVSGARVVLHNRGLLLLYGMLLLVVVTLMPTFTLTPLLVREHFGGGVNQVALMEGLAGIGIIAGGALIAVWPIFKRKIVTVLVSFAISCATVAFTALTPGNMLWVAALWWALSGVTFSTGNAPMMAILQTRVPNHLQGRVLALMTTLMGLGGPIGLAGAAIMGDIIGVRWIFVFGGLSAAAICLLGFAMPSLMRIEETPIRSEWEPAPETAAMRTASSLPAPNAALPVPLAEPMTD